MQNLVYAEVSVTFQMLEDKQVVIISDTGVFMITTEENSKNYDETDKSVNRVKND